MRVVLTDDTGLSSVAPTLTLPSRSPMYSPVVAELPSPTRRSPEYAPFGRAPTPVPPGFGITGTLAARHGTPPLWVEIVDNAIHDVDPTLAAPPPPPLTSSARHHASEVANRRPRLIRT
uniref:Uncharacterized protein n=1 Tax=Arundo donax TaxID=35708 RepID=A0A0A9AIS3_ARUDO